jgi:hypothetical protein
LKRREAKRAKEARKAEKAASAPQNDVVQHAQVNSNEDDLNPNVCALIEMTRSFVQRNIFVF